MWLGVAVDGGAPAVVQIGTYCRNIRWPLRQQLLPANHRHQQKRSAVVLLRKQTESSLLRQRLDDFSCSFVRRTQSLLAEARQGAIVAGSPYFPGTYVFGITFEDFDAKHRADPTDTLGLSEGRTRREFILRRTLTGWLTVFGSSDSWTVVSLRHTGPLRGALSSIRPCLRRCSGEACPRPSVLMANWFNFNSIGTCVVSSVPTTLTRSP
jgi:hypothetical protein